MVRMGRAPDPWQAQALRSRRKRRALLASRQSGKGEVATAAAINKVASRPECRVAVVAPTLRQSALLLRRIRRALPLAAPHLQATNNAATTLTVSNGSELLAVPGSRPDMIRGDTLDLLLVDESAFVLPELFTVALPMLLATDGEALMMSTPGGPTGLMFDVMTAADNDPLAQEWERFRVPASQIPRFSPEQLLSLRRSMGERAYRVEMELDWREDAAAVFTADELARILGTDPVADVLPGEGPLPDDDAPGGSWRPDPWASIVLPPI
ncbi:terminase large subunit domain-containing protein [Pimelobacter simplex]|uniref:terminase large subunit domain-containing protein n=1 Tax=Nocardioides simplex TaxID=2045 RepID=UPI0037F5FB5F